MSDGIHLRSFFSAFVEDIKTSLFHHNASHILELTLSLSFLRHAELDLLLPDQDENTPKTLKESLGVISTFLRDNVWDVMEDQYGSHVLRTLVILSGGCKIEQKRKGQHKSGQSDQRKRKITKVQPIPYPLLWDQLSSYILSLPHLQAQLVDTLTHPTISLVYQDYLEVCSIISTSIQTDGQQSESVSDFDFGGVCERLLGSAVSLQSPILDHEDEEEEKEEEEEDDDDDEEEEEKEEQEEKEEKEQAKEETKEQTSTPSPSDVIAAVDTPIYKLVTDSVGSRIVEAALRFSSQQFLVKFYQNQHIQHNALFFALHPSANHVLQVLMEHIEDPFIGTTIIDTLLDHLLRILQGDQMKIELEDGSGFQTRIVPGNAGVVLNLLKLCGRQKYKQLDAVKALRDILSPLSATPFPKPFFFLRALQLGSVPIELSPDNKDDLTDYISKLDTLQEKIKRVNDKQINTVTIDEIPKPVFCSYLGTQICNTLLTFESRWAQIFVDSVCSLPNSSSLSLATNPYATHFVQMFIRTKEVTKKRKTGWTMCLADNAAMLCKHPNGCRVVEAVFEASSIVVKEKICAGMMKESREILATQFGKIAYRSFDVDGFWHRRKEWTRNLEKQEKAVKLIGNTVVPEKVTTQPSRRHDPIPSDDFENQGNEMEEDEEMEGEGEEMNIEPVIREAPKEKKRHKRKDDDDDEDLVKKKRSRMIDEEPEKRKKEKKRKNRLSPTTTEISGLDLRRMSLILLLGAFSFLHPFIFTANPHRPVVFRDEYKKDDSIGGHFQIVKPSHAQVNFRILSPSNEVLFTRFASNEVFNITCPKDGLVSFEFDPPYGSRSQEIFFHLDTDFITPEFERTDSADPTLEVGFYSLVATANTLTHNQALLASQERLRRDVASSMRSSLYRWSLGVILVTIMIFVYHATQLKDIFSARTSSIFVATSLTYSPLV
ncbi:putative nucleolar protein 9 [Blattamonas nauphoetae]|uniref:Nucleolar protein 9 n=1 Tax=Blattamonas nauphoetae TaxID=2049346 RepID=A0ABQ9XX72_9EUKA|nr:putative nucleolar protein 9 [Blattamonas nauphoetae]